MKNYIVNKRRLAVGALLCCISLLIAFESIQAISVKDGCLVLYHIKAILKSGELSAEATIRKIRIVQVEGGRQVSRPVDFHNLDMIISIGYRVNSMRATRFRQWATSVLKEYLLRGLVRDQRIGKLEKRMSAAERSIDTIIYTLMPALPENREPIGFHT